MVVASIVIVLLVGLSGGYIAMAVSEAKANQRTAEYAQQLYAADAGSAVIIDSLNARRLPLPLVAGQSIASSGYTISTLSSAGVNEDGDGTTDEEGAVADGVDNDGDGRIDEDSSGVKAVVTGAMGGVNFTTSAMERADGRVTVISTGYRADEAALADSDRRARRIQTIVTGVPLSAPSFSVLAAVTSDGPVQTLGNINIDGRDHDENNALNGDPGTWGITATQSIDNGGASGSGGNGVAPLQNSPLTNQADYTYAGKDNDLDGRVDEEAADGVDNDGDGRVDEDTSDFPASPDAFVGVAPGTLKALALASGTYFTTETDFDAAVTANGGKVPGGRVVYLDFPTWGPDAEFGSSFNDPPSILVHHQEGSTAVAKNLHGMFKGLFIADGIDHVNSGTQILGALAAFATSAAGNAFGNGDSDINFSSSVLGRLPNVNPLDVGYRTLAWREITETSFTLSGTPNTSGDPGQIYEGDPTWSSTSATTSFGTGLYSPPDPGAGSTSSTTSAPGQSGDAPGQSGTPPGQSPQ